MGKNWEEKKLGEITEIITGTTPDTKNNLYWNGKEYWITPAEISNDLSYINNTVRKITKLAIKRCSLRSMPKGTVIFSSRAPIGKIAINNIDNLYCNQGFKNFICSNKIINKFLCYFLLYKKDNIIDLGKGTTFKEVSKKIVSDIKIKLPSLQEQKQIVEKLDKAFADIDKLTEIAKQNLENSKELFNSYLNKLFTENNKYWEETTLNDICKIERGASPRPIDKFITNDKDGINWIKIGDVSEKDKYIAKTKQKITKIGAEKSRFVYIGDLILSNSMSYGRPYIMKINGCIHDGWFVLRINKNLINLDFLYILLSSFIAQEQYNKLAAGSVVKNISSDLIKKVKIPLPPLQQQKQIVKILDNLQEKTKKLEEIYNKKIELAKELKQSVLHKELQPSKV